jgi:Zn-dependent peptidase ImmA (M78 family)
VLSERQATAMLRTLAVHHPPVPSEVITDLPFVTVARRTPMRSSGATRWMKPRWVILINGAEPAGRQRFSLAHEFKHVLDHPNVGLMYGPAGGSTRREHVERLCDYFAGCLLVPRPWLKTAFASGIQDLGELADLFQVSQPAMQVRLLQVGLVEPYARCAPADTLYLRALPSTPVGLAA